MIHIQDNFLPQDAFAKLKDWVSANKFQIHNAGGKNFSVMPVPDQVIGKIQIEGYEMILAFLRNANSRIDTDLRIHCDGIINNKRTSIARVLYITGNEDCGANGTAFYKHHKHGIKADDDISKEEFNRLITVDAGDKSSWTKTDFTSAVPNRLLTYDASYFHSKWPQKIEIGERVVLVAFYSKA